MSVYLYYFYNYNFINLVLDSLNDSLIYFILKNAMIE